MESETLRECRCLAPDLPGYGKSPWPEDAAGLEDHAEAVARWLRDAADEPVVLVGHSMGGVVGLLLAERHPERIRGFLNVEGNVSAGDCKYSGPIAEYSVSEFLERGRREILDRVYRLGIEDPPHRGYYASLRFADPRTLYRNSRELVELSREEGLADRLAVLAPPCRYLYGRPRGTGSRSRELLREAGIATLAVDGAGHWPFQDRPREFLVALRSFLNELE